MGARVTGIIEGRKAFARLPEEMRDAIYDVHLKTAAAVAQDARSRVRRRTGLLARSIDYTVSKRTGVASVGVVRGPAYYGHFHEFGTIHMPAHPFMQPAAEGQRGPLEERFRLAGRVVEKNLESIGSRNL